MKPIRTLAKYLSAGALSVALLTGGLSSAQAGPNVTDVRIGSSKERTRLVLDLSDRVSFKVFSLDKPNRIVVDLPSLQWPEKLQPKVQGLIDSLRFGQFTAAKSRLVIDLKSPAIVSKSFVLNRTSGLPVRLVVDLVEASPEKFTQQVVADRETNKRQLATLPEPVPRAVSPPSQKRQPNAKPVIVIDAGHGGVDPGALGRSAREKNVTLNFAREFAKQLRSTGKYDVYLTRNRDIYIPLRQRVDIARKHKADLFVSIHADAIERSSVRGLSIYTLSETASDAEAASLARKENRSDIIAGIDFDDQPKEVADILIDLAQRETKNLSVEFAKLVVTNASGSTKLLDRTHRFAGFRVLKAPDVPSVLIELGFLTNRSDEKQLLSAAWHRKLAGRLVNSVHGYFSKDRVAGLPR
jgi:N-acetylmuramoyl-L-alanine amidase